MNNPVSPEVVATKTLIRGIHLELTEALKRMAEEKAARLLRHNSHIIRVRIDLEHDKTTTHEAEFIAKGLIEIGGPDLLATVASDDAYKSLDLLIDKLDNMLRRRSSQMKEKRNHPHSIDLDAALPKAI